MLEMVDARTLFFCWHTDLATYRSGDTATTCRPSSILYASLSPRPSPPSISPSSPAVPTQNNISTGDDAGYLRKLRATTRPNQDSHESGNTCSRSRSRSRSISHDTRRGEPSKEDSRDETEDEQLDRHQDPPTKRVDSPIRAAREEDQSPPGSGVSRPQLSPATGERHQLASPRSTKHRRPCRRLCSPRSTERHA